MEYDAIILELMSRIKIVEEKCKEMEMRLAGLESQAASMPLNVDNGMLEEQTGSTNVYMKMTDEKIDICYEYGKKAYQNPGLDIGKLADEAAVKVEMNRSSAFMYIWAVKDMLEGEVYKRAISGKATERYFDKIRADYGKNGLKRAVKATWDHIAYRQSLGHTVDGLIKLCEKYEQI